MITHTPTLTGRRVTLRPYSAGFSAQEITTLYRWATDGDLLTLSGGRPLDMPFSRFQRLFLDQLPRHNSHSEQLFAILDESDRLIGRTGLFELGLSGQTAELGIVIGERDRWGSGYGRDAVRTLVTFGFELLGLEQITLNAYTDNVRALRAYEAVGFRAVRTRRRFSFERGSYTELEMALRWQDVVTPPDEGSEGSASPTLHT